MKTLIIAEKPSVATDLARVLSGVKKQGDYYEGEQLVISSAVGHVVELSMPEDFDKKWKAWRLGSLPIIPEKFTLKPIERNKDRFNLLKKLMARKDVETIINACDAGREGELIFTYLYELAKCKKPVKRMWMQSMTPASIKKAFESPRDAMEMEGLREAARCRSESDWLVGINGTRALTVRMYGQRGRQIATVGRVQTPTLAMVVQREREIRSFEPRDYWRVVGQFSIDSGQYEGVLQKKDWKKGNDEHDRADRIWEKEEALNILSAVESLGKAVVEESSKRSKQSSPRLYDLTTLQREANGRFGFPAGKTLKVAQALYEKHKVLTYPRTDSRALPEDYIQTAKDTLKNLDNPWQEHAGKVLKENWVTPNKRIFNNKGISDHFAIIPTGEKPKKLTTDEEKIYDMVTRRFIAVFYPPAEFDVTTRFSKAGDYTFKTEGKVLVEAGWMAVYGKALGADNILPELSEADGKPPLAKIADLELQEDATRPPPRYTEATLLSAMEGAGKLVEDEELADAMKEKGLGTPATRANIIDHLAREKYILREGRELAPSPKAEELIDFLSAVKVEDLTSPSLTGEWEFKLKKMEEGIIKRENFMDEITSLTKKLVERASQFNETEEDLPTVDLASPTDGKPLREAMRFYRSQDGELTLYKTVGNRKMEIEEYAELLKEGRIGPIDGFISKAGKPFSAMLKLDEDNKVKFDFGNQGNGANGDAGKEMENLKEFPVVAEFPGSKVLVRETPTAYIAEDYDPEKRSGFRLSRSLLGKTIPPEEIRKLMEDGKTGLIEGFRSKRTNRLFSAHLILKDKGDIGFEFPPRAAKKAAKKTAKKVAKKATKK